MIDPKSRLINALKESGKDPQEIVKEELELRVKDRLLAEYVERVKRFWNGPNQPSGCLNSKLPE